jgi:hypothetical protein
LARLISGSSKSDLAIDDNNWTPVKAKIALPIIVGVEKAAIKKKEEIANKDSPNLSKNTHKNPLKTNFFPYDC